MTTGARPPVAGTPGGHEQALAARGVRKGLGAYYTPPDVVEGLLDVVLAPLLAAAAAAGTEAVAALRVLDPACGTGNVLVAAVARIGSELVRLGVDPASAAASAASCASGVELDPGTAAVCRAALPGADIRVGDALIDPSLVEPGAFDLVVGNPPFLSQLASSTARPRAQASALRDRFGSAVSAYTDPSALFLLAGLDAARPDGGVVCLIQPVSVLSARDAGAVRRSAVDRAGLVALWVAGEPVFDAEVEVCAPVLVRGRSAATTALLGGRSVQAAGEAPTPGRGARSWAGLLAALQQLPERSLVTDGTVGDLAAATADFRDQYYGLAGAVVDEPTAADGRSPALVTSGLIDPAHLAWGERPCRVHKASFVHPRVRLDRVAPELQAWAARRMVPKLLVATQTRVLEVVADADGGLLPSVPVVTVTPTGAPDGPGLWHLGAVLSSPALTLVAARRHLGSARNAGALRLSASDVLALPVPPQGAAWDAGAAAFAQASRATDPHDRHQHLLVAARAVDEAFGLAGDEELLAWWADRLPRR